MKGYLNKKTSKHSKCILVIWKVETPKHIHAQAQILGTYVCGYCSLKACCNRRKYTLRGTHILCRLAHPSAATGRISRCHLVLPEALHKFVSRSVRDKPFVKYAMDADYDSLQGAVDMR
uniref:Uncharacterized protein n=1 Tax=Rhipicephalus zambeziensis TaxID=60191 RepID=A0A224YG14_9ACAR